MDDRTTVGLDLGDKTSQVCVLDASGEVSEESCVRTTPLALGRYFERLKPSRVACEVGTHSPWVSKLVEELGHEMLVANARQLPLIYKSSSKNDRIDAERLARLARVDPKLLHPIEHRSREAQATMAVLRGRDVLVRSRTMLINHVRGVAKSTGLRIKSCAATSFHNHAAVQLESDLLAAVTPILNTIADLTRRIRRLDRQIEQLCADRYPVTELLRQVPGVGALTALWYVLVIGNPNRFTSSRRVGPYVGLRPRQSQSGQGDPELSISKAGDRHLRRLLVQAAHYTLGPFGIDSDLRRHGLALAGRGGKNAKKRAVVAIARKLAVLLHALWVNGEEYEPLRNTTAAA